MRRLIVPVVFLLVWLIAAPAASAEVKLGMLAQRGADAAVREWGPLVDYLSAQIGEKVVLVPLKFTEVREWWRENPDGVMFANPWFYVRAKVRRGAKALVTVKYMNSGATMGGVIFTKADSGIRSLLDLRGKSVMVPKLSSPGGWLFQKGEIVKAGIVPERDFRVIIETPEESHDDVVYAVRDGKADAGTVRTNLLEAMQREGKIDPKEFRILNPMEHPGFRDLCSTPLYPDWPVFALQNTPPETAERIKQVLLAIPPGHPVLEKARRIDRFVDALDYGPLEDLCRKLGVAPFR
jgi:ABC-type phosphate/phosphonate transport system substrate-binding protein